MKHYAIILNMKSYFLDNASTTKVFDEAIEYASDFLSKNFFNPSAVYEPSIYVKREISTARNVIAKALGVSDGKIIFTASATEANNMVVFSQRINPKKRFLFGMGEHPSVLECAKELKNRGANVEFIPLDKTGRVDMEKYKAMLGDDVAFISVQHVSNETGAINPIQKLVRIAKKQCKDVLFHSDGVQAFMKQEFSVDSLDVDYYTISAHKIGGPKGIGALYVKKGVKIQPLIYGGGQEEGLRSGTENVFNIMAFKKAVEIMSKDQARNLETIKSMRAELLSELKKNQIDYILHGEDETNIISLSPSRVVRGETLLHALEKRGVYVSTGSACSSNKHFNSTLEAMQIEAQEILTSIRISLSPYMDFDAKEIAKIIKEELLKLEGKNYG